MGIFDKDEPSWTDRVYAAATSGHPDVSSSLTARSPNVGERAIASGFLGAGANLTELAKMAKKSS